VRGEFNGLIAGVLALQGAYAAHARALTALGASVREVRFPKDLPGIQALCMPGGESTAMSLLMDKGGLREPLRELLAQSAEGSGGPAALATCAGAILLARELLHDDGSQKVNPLGLFDALVDRNAFGRQVDSFEADICVDWNVLGGEDKVTGFHGVFIRAPRFAALGEKARPCGWLRGPDGSLGEAVLARQNRIFAASFHPELSGDLRIHRALLKLVRPGED
jgi:5'-phosphate synthase pdxT subunit